MVTSARHPASGFRLRKLDVDPAVGTVCGPGGCERLDPKVMAVLVAFAERAGELVTREELLERVWGNVQVTDDAVSRCIYQLRRQFGRAGGDSSYRKLIETLPKRGYRLAEAVVTPAQNRLSETRDHLVPGTSDRPLMWRSRIAAGIVLLAVVVTAAAIVAGGGDERSATSAARDTIHGEPIIAVLAFDDLSAAQDQEYFADGVVEGILNELARSGLNVIARNSSFAFKGKPVEISTVAGALGATHVVEGSVRRSDSHVSLTVQLIDAASSLHVWSNVYTRELGDILRLQDEIAAAVADALHVKLTGRTRRPVDFDIVPEAYDAFLQAHHLYNRRGPGDLERAEARYRAAVQASPQFARAWAGLAAVYNVMLWERMHPSPSEALDKMRIAVEAALAADPDHVDVQLRAANYYMWIGDFERADAMRNRAAELDPDDPLLLAVLSGAAAQNGRFEESVQIGRRAIARDPLSVVTRSNLARSLIALGRCAEAAELFHDVAAMTPPDDENSREIDWELARIAVCEGRDAEAVALADRLPPGIDRDQILALAARSLGHVDVAAAALDRLLADDSWRAALAAATVYAWRKDAPRAHERLEVAYAAALREDRIAIDGLVTRARESPFTIGLRDTEDWRTWIVRIDETWRNQWVSTSIRQADAS